MTMHVNSFGFWFGRKKNYVSNHDKTGYDAKWLLKRMTYQEGIEMITAKRFIHAKGKKSRAGRPRDIAVIAKECYQ